LIRMLKSYLQNIFKIANRVDATEESFYSALKSLLMEIAEANNKSNIHITTLPKKTEAGNPDFRVWDGKQHIVGYVEAKAPTIDNLNQIEDSEQLERYRHTFPNLVLTNFFEFRLYRNGDLISKVSIARPFIVHELQTVPPVENEAEFFALLQTYFAFSLPKVYNAKKLAVELAKRTRFLKDEVVAEELKEEKAGRGFILGFYEAFQKYLINGLTKKDFADLYSQTITYGLFAARTRSKNGFNRKLAYANIPHTIGILRDVFRFISLEDVPPQMEWIVDDISEVLAVTDVNKILHQYFHEGKGRDPIVHFYETFLAEYDPKTREKRGVYYTPEPVVSYIVRSIHQILKDEFDKPDGLANNGVTVLDPAAGTLTFMAEAAKCAVEEFVTKHGEGAKENFIKEQILENYYAFELMMAPYAVGHLKISFLLEELGYRLKEDDRFQLYLTNTLEMEELAQTELPGMASLSEESHLAGAVKKEKPILVILGNPPYSVSSTNKSDFIEKEMELYKEDVRSEKNIQPLSDDYIKFIRFAHWKIDQAGEGVIGMISNNSYLSGLIHRGMRAKLLESFNKIFILNLHGSSRIGEKSPDGGKDENVFNIMQGVAIIICIKNLEKKAKKEIYYADCWGTRLVKHNYLNKNSLETTNWQKLVTKSPFYPLIPQDFSKQKVYNKYISIREAFNSFTSGVKTHRDNLVVGFTINEIKQKLLTFTSNLPDSAVREGLQLKETKDWILGDARKKLKEMNWEKYIRKYNYRPYDIRYICYVSDLIDRDRWNIMQNFLKDNIGLILMRKPIPNDLTQVLVSENLLDLNFYAYQTYIFPLYIYDEEGSNKKEPKGSTLMLFESKEGYGKKKSNLNPYFVEQLNKTFKKTPVPEDIFNYIYAVLYSNTYRNQYAEFLRIDFPRIPFTKNYQLFKKMDAFGKELIDLHLMQSSKIEKPIAKFQGQNGNKVTKLEYQKDESRVYINSKKYFEGVEENVWEYQIGSYQVCSKWLKDRKGRILSLEEIKHYCKVVTAIHHTIKIQEKIDSIYDEVEKDIITF